MPEALPIEPPTLLARADASRKIANGKLNMETRTAFGQYMTPAAVASFMASLFPPQPRTQVRLLDRVLPASVLGIGKQRGYNR
ncbi:MAG: hypothetical protein HQK89_18060, partial [Nitrospirae bacterium]|nr:hypothetical protein [Nitrospirota bacterium]